MKKKTQMSSRGMSDSGRTMEMVIMPRENVSLEITEKNWLYQKVSKLICNQYFHLRVRTSSPYCSHLGLFDSGLSFGVKGILLIFLFSVVQIYIPKY